MAKKNQNNDVEETSVFAKVTPEDHSNDIVETPGIPSEEMNVPEVPEVTDITKDLPSVFNLNNTIIIEGEPLEIKPTKMKYFRNKTAATYKLLQIYPIADFLAVPKGTFDKDRDGDKMLFDFLIAALDNAEYVKAHYDGMVPDDIYKILEIFCRLNKITEKEEELKNRQAKETKI